MATVIKLKRSTVASRVPTTSDLSDGEVGINITDGKIYVNNGGTIVEVANTIAQNAATKVLERNDVPFFKTGDLSTANATFDLKASGGGERIFNDFTLASGSAITTQEKTLFSF